MPSNKKDILWRIYLSFLGLLLVAVLILVQAFRIQVVQGSKWRSIADSLTTSFHTIPAARGNVYADDGRLLATSLPSFEIRMDMAVPAMTDQQFYNQVDSLAWHLSRLFKNKSQAAYKKMLVNGRHERKHFQLIHRKVNYPQLEQLKKFPLFRLGRYKGGLIVIKSNKRKNPFGLLAHRTIGYVRTGPGSQSVGLEAYFNNYLSGTDGKRLMQKISGGVWMPVNDRDEIETVNGDDLITTLNVNIQDAAEYALMQALEKNNANHGSVIVMEVATGQIKAIANLGKTSQNDYWEKYNYAIGEGSEPGSTFKLATMMSLLEDAYIKLSDSVDLENGKHKYYDRWMKDSEHHRVRNVSIRKAFEISSNVGISKLAYRYYSNQPEKFVAHLRAFGLDKLTGIQIKGEPAPMIKSPGDAGWSAISIPWMSVGYEVQLTPLQILNFYNAVANNGKLMKPYLISGIQHFGKRVETFGPQVLNPKICSASTVKQLQSLLKGVADSGTARNIRSKAYSIAGKTGTAQIADKNQGYRKIYQSSFVGYFPAENPVYSCIVVISAPSAGAYYGSSVAAPVFKEIADKIFTSDPDLARKIDTSSTAVQHYVNRGFEPEFEIIYKTLAIPYKVMTPDVWIYTAASGDTISINKTRMPSNKLVPNVKQMGLRDALYLLETQGLKVEISGKGKVIRQSIQPGVRVEPGMIINIELG